jgi:hypothetical protein
MLNSKFFSVRLSKKKVYLGGMSILSILLSLESGCHSTGAQVAGSCSNGEGLCMELHGGRREDDRAMHSFATPTIALPRFCSIFE